MFISTALLALLSSQVDAFNAAFVPRGAASRSALFSASTEEAKTAKKQSGGMADELAIPCADECAMESYPNLPESVHPGVLSGQPMMDLLEDAKKKGACFFVCFH